MTRSRRTPGKAHGLVRISDGFGRYSMLAVDQRPPLLKLVSEALGTPENVVGAEVGLLKGLIADALAGAVTGLLIDPFLGYPRVLSLLPRATGLLLTLEDHRFETTADGYRRSGLIRGWDVDAAVRAGADALKLLVWYRPDAPADVRTAQEALVRLVGDACARVDRPFVLELLLYPLAGEPPDVYAHRFPDLSRDLVEAFAARSFLVDLYKLALPGRPDGVREWGGTLYGLPDLGDAMARTTRLLPAPWVLLSGGMPSDHFIESLRLAAAAGARGYLAGRAIWWRAVEAYPDIDAVRRRLNDDASRVLQSLNRIVQALPPGPPASDWRVGTRGPAPQEEWVR